MLEVIRRIRMQQFHICEGKVFWRADSRLGQPAPAQMITSVADPVVGEPLPSIGSGGVKKAPSYPNEREPGLIEMHWGRAILERVDCG